MNTDSLIYDVIKQVCDNHGGYLPEPRNQRENKFLHNLGTGAFLLGMSDSETEGEWVWDSDGSEVGWQNWMDFSSLPDEPNGGDNENCAVFAQQIYSDIAGHRTDRWADVPCDSDIYVGSKPTSLICERNPGLFICYDLDLVLITVYFKC